MGDLNALIGTSKLGQCDTDTSQGAFRPSRAKHGLWVGCGLREHVEPVDCFILNQLYRVLALRGRTSSVTWIGQQYQRCLLTFWPCLFPEKAFRSSTYNTNISLHAFNAFIQSTTQFHRKRPDTMYLFSPSYPFLTVIPLNTYDEAVNLC